MSGLGVLAMSLKLNIENFSAELKKVQDDIKITQEKLGGFEKLGKGFEDIGKTLTLGVTTPIVGAGTAAVKFASDMETSMAKISSIADSTQVPIDDLKKSILDMSSESGESTAVLTEGLYDALSSGVQTKDAVEFLSVAVKDAKGGFTDTATAVDGLTSVLNGYGRESSEALKISNEMMIAQNLGKTTFGEMASVMGNIVPTANALKVESNELFSSMAVLTSAGIKTSESVTGLKAAFSNIVKPTNEASAAAEALGLDFSASAVESKGWKGFLVDLRDKLAEMAPEYAKAIQRQADLRTSMAQLEEGGKKNTDEYKAMSAELKALNGNVELLEGGSNSTISAFATMFGSVEGLNTVLTLTSEQGMKLYDESMQQMGGTTDYVNEAYETMNNTTSANFAKVKETFKNTLAELGVQLLPLVNTVLQGIKSLVDGFNSLSPSAKSAILVIAGMAATVGPTLLILGKFATAITSIGSSITMLKGAYSIVKGFKIVQGLGSVKTAFTGLKSVMSLSSIIPLITGPVGIAIGALTAIIAVGVLVYKNWDTIKETGSRVGTSIKESWNGTCDKVKGFFGDLSNSANEKWGQMKNYAKDHVVGLSTAIGGPVAGTVTYIAKNWDDIKSKTEEKFKGVKESAISALQGIINDAPSKLNSVKDKFTSGFTFLSDLKKSALTWGSDMIDGFVNGIKNSIGKVTGAVTQVANKVKSYLHFSVPDEGPLTEYEEWMPDFMSGLGIGIRENTNKVLAPLKNLTDGMNISSRLILQPSVTPSISSDKLSSQQVGGYTNNAPIMQVEHLYVRNDNDVSNISRSIYNENMNVIRALGKR